MRADILNSTNPDEVRAYLSKKFKIFDSWTYSKDRRDKKCINYYLCASDNNKKYVEAAYYTMFKSQFPKSLANQIQSARDRKASGPNMIESSEWMDKQADRRDSAQLLLDQLIRWKEDGSYQEGETFFLKLQSRVAEFDSSLVNPKEFLTEKEVKRVATLTGSKTKSAKEVQAEFEGMVGIKQRAEIKFEAY